MTEHGQRCDRLWRRAVAYLPDAEAAAAGALPRKDIARVMLGRVSSEPRTALRGLVADTLAPAQQKALDRLVAMLPRVGWPDPREWLLERV